MMLPADPGSALVLLSDAVDVQRRTEAGARGPVTQPQILEAGAALGIDASSIWEASLWTNDRTRAAWRWIFGVPTSMSWTIDVGPDTSSDAIRSAIVECAGGDATGTFLDTQDGFRWQLSDRAAFLQVRATQCIDGHTDVHLVSEFDRRLALLAWIAPLSGAFSAAIVLNVLGVHGSLSEPGVIAASAVFFFAMTRAAIRRIAAAWHDRLVSLAATLSTRAGG